MNNHPEISLTGVGLISPLGTATDEFFSYLRDDGVPSGKMEQMAGIEPGQLIRQLNISDPKLKVSRYMDPVSKNAIVAMGNVTADAGISGEEIAADPCGYGIVLGATRGACVTREGLYDGLAAREGRLASGTLFSHCGYNIAGAMTAIAYGIKGPNITIAGRDDPGLSVLRRARQFLAAGRAHTVFAGFTRCDGVKRRGSAPFAEGAFILCLERKERALQRGARILAEVSEDEGTSGDRGTVYGFPGGDRHLSEGSAALRLPLPGMAALGEGFSTLLLLGLLAHDREIRGRFKASAFAAGTAAAGAVVRLSYGAGRAAE